MGAQRLGLCDFVSENPVKTIGTRDSGAIFSHCMKFRFRLWRIWNSELPRALFILLNPSTADEIHNDPTIERQQRRVSSWSGGGVGCLFEGLPSLPQMVIARKKGFGSIEVVNACAYRSTDPEALYEIEDPVGEDNGEHIHDACREAVASGGIIICGWGSHLTKLYSGKYPLHDVLLESIEEFPLAAFKLNNDSTPAHPLYLGYDLKPRRWFDGELHEEVV